MEIIMLEELSQNRITGSEKDKQGAAQYMWKKF
jgi:hypothetical protein